MMLARRPLPLLALLAFVVPFGCSGGGGGNGDDGADAGSDAAATAGGSGMGASGGSGGSSGSAGMATAGAAGMGMAGADAGPMLPVPERLSETGLYSDIAADTVSADARQYQPAWFLWSDGATKRRWLLLPPGEKIDTGDMDYWVFPVGTKVFKEFTRDGVRIETRMIEKTASGWERMAYVWNDAQTDAVATPDGMQDAKGTPHDVPRPGDCDTCHQPTGDYAISVSAIMLSHDGPGMTLQTLIDEDLLTDPPAAPFQVPGADSDRDVLGYLHANCGGCHNPTTNIFRIVPMELRLRVRDLGSLAETGIFRTAVGKTNLGSARPVIDPGNPDGSDLVRRMGNRSLGQMPPLGTEIVDDAALATVRSWIQMLPVGDGGAGDGGTGDAGTGDASAADAGDASVTDAAGGG